MTPQELFEHDVRTHFAGDDGQGIAAFNIDQAGDLRLTVGSPTIGSDPETLHLLDRLAR